MRHIIDRQIGIKHILDHNIVDRYRVIGIRDLKAVFDHALVDNTGAVLTVCARFRERRLIQCGRRVMKQHACQSCVMEGLTGDRTVHVRLVVGINIILRMRRRRMHIDIEGDGNLRLQPIIFAVFILAAVNGDRLDGTLVGRNRLRPDSRVSLNIEVGLDRIAGLDTIPDHRSHVCRVFGI